MSHTTTAPKQAKDQTRIDALRALIARSCDDPKCATAGACRHEGEKEAARHQLARILDRVRAAAEAAGAEGFSDLAKMWREIYERGHDSHGNTYWRGTNYRAGQSMTRRAAAIRADIKMARSRKMTIRPLVAPHNSAALSARTLALYEIDPIGEAPPDIKISVRNDSQGLSSSILITVSNIPEEWGWTAEEMTETYGDREHTCTRYRRTPALNLLEAELKAVANAYNADHGSNTMTDLFTKAFHVTVDSLDPEDEAREASCAARKLRAALPTDSPGLLLTSTAGLRPPALSGRPGPAAADGRTNPLRPRPARVRTGGRPPSVPGQPHRPAAPAVAAAVLSGHGSVPGETQFHTTDPPRPGPASPFWCGAGAHPSRPAGARSAWGTPSASRGGPPFRPARSSRGCGRLARGMR
ncbi:hypothetical protein ACWCQB_37685 [Streptomyces hirsutus]